MKAIREATFKKQIMQYCMTHNIDAYRKPGDWDAGAPEILLAPKVVIEAKTADNHLQLWQKASKAQLYRLKIAGNRATTAVLASKLRDGRVLACIKNNHLKSCLNDNFASNIFDDLDSFMQYVLSV
jgi:hypothetical protein